MKYNGGVGLPKHRLVVAAALAALVISLVSLCVTRRARHSARDPLHSGVTSDAFGAADGGPAHRPREPGAVRVGPPSMIHLNPRHTNRSPWSGPAEPILAWTFDAGGPIEAAPAVLDDGTIVVGTLHGKLFGVTPDGAQKFVVDLGERIYSSPLVWHGSLLVGMDRGKFFGLQTNGTARWKLETDGDADTGAAWTPWGGLVFASGKLLYAARVEGTLLWRVRARRKLYSSPAVGDDGTVFVGSQDDHVYAVAPDGKVRWRVSVGADADSAPAVGDDGTVFVGTDGGDVVAMSPTDGAVRWRRKAGGFVRGALAIARDGTVLAGTYGPRPRVVGLWPDDGSQRFEFAIQGTGAREFGIHGAPVEDAQGRLYFGAQDDFVYALRPDWTLLWKFATRGDVDAPVVITPAGLLLAGSDDGKLYAIRGKPKPTEVAAKPESGDASLASASGLVAGGGDAGSFDAAAAAAAVLSANIGPAAAAPTAAHSEGVVAEAPVSSAHLESADASSGATPATPTGGPAGATAVTGISSPAGPNGTLSSSGTNAAVGPASTSTISVPAGSSSSGASGAGSVGASSDPTASGGPARPAASTVP